MGFEQFRIHSVDRNDLVQYYFQLNVPKITHQCPYLIGSALEEAILAVAHGRRVGHPLGKGWRHVIPSHARRWRPHHHHHGPLGLWNGSRVSQFGVDGHHRRRSRHRSGCYEVTVLDAAGEQPPAVATAGNMAASLEPAGKGQPTLADHVLVDASRGDAEDVLEDA